MIDLEDFNKAWKKMISRIGHSQDELGSKKAIKINDYYYIRRGKTFKSNDYDTLENVCVEEYLPRNSFEYKRIFHKAEINKDDLFSYIINGWTRKEELVKASERCQELKDEINKIKYRIEFIEEYKDDYDERFDESELEELESSLQEIYDELIDTQKTVSQLIQEHNFVNNLKKYMKLV